MQKYLGIVESAVKKEEMAAEASNPTQPQEWKININLIGLRVSLVDSVVDHCVDIVHAKVPGESIKQYAVLSAWIYLCLAWILTLAQKDIINVTYID